jgi:hypothetical protein
MNKQHICTKACAGLLGCVLTWGVIVHPHKEDHMLHIHQERPHEAVMIPVNVAVVGTTVSSSSNFTLK